MSILTSTAYLDEITFSSGSQADYPGTYTTDWTDSDTGSGVSNTSGLFFDGKSCFKFDSGAAGAGNVAIRTRDVGTFATPEWISLKCYFETLGNLADTDYFQAKFDDSAYCLQIRFAADGLFVYDGAAWNEVGTNLVVQDTWQEWTFNWTVAAAGVVDVYLDGVLQASAVDCSYAVAGTDGTTTFSQYGTTVRGVTYLDFIKIGTAQRYGGETWEMREGGQLTVRTDTRWYKYSPASMAGSFGSITITEGKVIFDGTDVRWLPYDTGSGNVPAVGTSITQGSVTGILLGVWDSLTSAPTAVGSAVPTDGFIKFLSVTGGTFTTGALTGIGANATGPDVTGWIEIVADSAANITVPRLGEHEIRGDWFYLDNTNGSIAQTIQIPTNNGGASTYCPGVWVETSPSADTYEYWPALNGSTNGWARGHIGGAYGETDARQNFVKDVGGGVIQFGEASDLSATYANVAAQASTYATLAHSSTYTWANDIVTITYTTGHLLKTGAQVGLDFTSGGATAYDGTYTVTIIDAYTYTVPLAGSGSAGNVTVRPGVTVTFTAHTLGVGDTVYCDFTSGTGVDGDYTIYAVTSANAYLIAYPHTSALTSGNVSVYSRYAITYTAHGLAIGNRVYLDFTSGAGVDGIYTIIAVPDANTFHIVANNDASADSGNVTIKQTIGNVPVSGCKTRIPNVFLRECATGTRASNMVNATAATRPEWATTTAGAIDIEYAYTTWYMNFAQPYSVKLYHSSTYDSLITTEVATALDIDDVHTSMYGALDAIAYTATSNFAGGTVENCKFQRGNTPGTSDHAVSISYCKNITFNNITGGIIQFARSTGKAFNQAYNNGCKFNNCRGFNSDFPMTACLNIEINDYDHVDRYIGYTNASTAYYGIVVGAGSSNIVVDGLTFGFNGTVPNVHPYSGIYNYTATSNCIFKNAGTRTTPLASGSWRPNLYALAVTNVTGGNNDTIKLQRVYIDDNSRTGVFATINSDKNITYESVHCGLYVMSAMAIATQIDAGLNSIIKGGRAGTNTTTGQSSVYGTHFWDFFSGDTVGRLILSLNETTTETSSQFTMVSGTAKFNSSGGILMGNVNDQAIFEDSVFRRGHTGFQNVTPTMSGGTIGNYTLEYDIDVGSGYSNSWTTLSGANLSAISTIDPNIGFKIKIRITTTTANITAITYLRIDTTTSVSAQTTGLYAITVPVTSTITVKDIVTLAAIENARVLLLADSDGPMPSNETVTISNTGTTATVTHTGHGMETGDKVQIKGASLQDNNGVFTITYISDDSYSYTMSNAPGSSPTGTIKATYVVISGLTNSSGVITASKYFPSNQPVTGRIRRASSGTLYKTGSVVGTINASTGFDTTVQMIMDT